jgi:mRNA interferase YafQ
MEPRRLNATNKFEKEVELAKRRGKDVGKLRSVIDLLVNRQPLPRELVDHPLKGEFTGYRDLHIEPDWLLIYKVDRDDLWLSRTGSHADLFGK